MRTYFSEADEPRLRKLIVERLCPDPKTLLFGTISF